MKKLLLLGLVVVAAVVCAIATPMLIVGTLQTVNNTTFTSSTNVLSLNYPTPMPLTVTHGGLANTNDILIKEQVSTDLTNWITFASFGMTQTGATTESFPGYNFPLTNYYRALVTTTNSQGISAGYGN